jgi:hypothetical protein
LHWDGASWTAFASGVSLQLLRIWGSSADDIWVAGDGVRPGTARQAIDAGRRAGEALARALR